MSETQVTLAEALAIATDHLTAGRFAEAEPIYRQILALQPGNDSMCYVLGVITYHTGRYDEALELSRQAVSMRAGNADYLTHLGMVLARLNQGDEAQQVLGQALKVAPQLAEPHFHLGYLYTQRGWRTRAEMSFRKAIELNPDYADAYVNLGGLYREQGMIAKAETAFREALRIDPDHGVAYNNLGLALLDQSKIADATDYFRKAIRCAPTIAAFHLNLGTALHDQGQVDAALPCFEQATRLDPRFPLGWFNLGNALREAGRITDAAAAYARGLDLDPRGGIFIKAATMLLPIMPDTAEIELSRVRVERNLLMMLQQPQAFADPLQDLCEPFFFTAYHGQSDKVLHTRLAQLYLAACPSLDWTAPHCRNYRGVSGRRPRIGIISRFLSDHSIGKTSRGLIAEIDRSKFEVIVLSSTPKGDATSRFVQQHADRYVVLPRLLAEARELIASLQLDILFYQDIGMESVTYFLAFARLAPVQCVSFGHPDTTGIPNLDYWVSNDLFEPEGAAEHYSEQLFLLRDLPTLAYYYRPQLPETLKTRADFGLPAERNLYLCPQTLFKFHPDFDSLLAGILRSDPNGELILIAPRVRHWQELLTQRFQRTLSEFLPRIRFLPQMPMAEFNNLIAVCDVMLDTLHFNGMNTSLEALAFGTPVVTKATGFQRGRHTQAMYRSMGYTELIANTSQDYIALAARLGRDREFRENARRQILERNSVLFENPRVVREFERFFDEALAACNP